jgi:Uma2 family endonuclease
VQIPGWVINLDSFRRWARSDDYPRRGWFCYLNGVIWVDLSMEQLFTHNQVKGEFAFAIMGVLKGQPLGRFFHDRTLLSNPAADLSCEPDGSFVSWEALRGGRVRLVEGAQHGYVEMEGTPDLVLEVVSDSSVRKDTETLLQLYWRAGIPEYWLVDARGPEPTFRILRHTPTGYVAVADQGGWLPSGVFGRSFRLTRQADPLGYPQFTVAVQP